MRFDIFKNQFIEQNHNLKKLAISGSDIDLTWGEFYEKVEHLKNQIVDLQIPKGHPVIIYGHKEHYFIVAIVALMQLEIPYIPIDNILPEKGIEKIKKITGSQVLVNCSDQKLTGRFPLELYANGIIKTNNASIFENNIYWNKKDPIRYIIFTSGSTGEPKGVQITRSSVESFTEWLEKDFGFSGNDIFLNQVPFSFDVSLFETYSFLNKGASVVLTDRNIAKDATSFIERIKKYQCSVWISTPSFAYMYLMSEQFNSHYLPNIHTFLFAGEELPGRTVQVILKEFSGSRVLNSYGPTEATNTCTLIEITNDILQKYNPLPIGYPKFFSEILIDNNNKSPEELGEIILVGDNVSVGYFKNEELNKRKFFIHNGKRAFKTGDLGYYENGMVFFCGRKDDQIKLHGYRIELNDINIQLQSINTVKESVTVPLKEGNIVKRIIAFVQLHRTVNKKSLTKNPILSELKKILPEYMIPSDISIVDSFPVNANHKIDKKQLIKMYMQGLLKK